jgi:hypothetical protein
LFAGSPFTLIALMTSLPIMPPSGANRCNFTGGHFHAGFQALAQGFVLEQVGMLRSSLALPYTFSSLGQVVRSTYSSRSITNPRWRVEPVSSRRPEPPTKTVSRSTYGSRILGSRVPFPFSAR